MPDVLPDMDLPPRRPSAPLAAPAAAVRSPVREDLALPRREREEDVVG
jgi:hypothetical protein